MLAGERQANKKQNKHQTTKTNSPALCCVAAGAWKQKPKVR
jgi:hypothetical protein